MDILRQLFLRASRSRWLARRLPRLAPVRKAVRRFIPGETMEEALDAARRLEERGLASVLTHLGENVETAGEAEEEVAHYSRVLEEAGRRELDAEISVKLTHLGLDQDLDLAVRNVTALARRAAELDNFVWIDMEASDYTDVTLEVFRRVRRDHPRVGVCLQAYLHRTPGDLERLLEEGASLRLVKGAYDEPPSVALRRKSSVDAAFVRLGRRMLEAAREQATRQTFGSHDLRILRKLAGAAGEMDVPADRYEFQMLYGIRNRQLEALAELGHTCRVLVSYGEEWFPWYMRRLAERPSNVLFVLRSLFRR